LSIARGEIAKPGNSYFTSSFTSSNVGAPGMQRKNADGSSSCNAKTYKAVMQKRHRA
jgi:hypothetical protein